MIALPTVNLNGTEGTRLELDATQALKALNTAIECLISATPHGRDYQLTQGLYERAAREHAARVSALTAVRDELHEIVRSIHTQNIKRSRPHSDNHKR